MSQGDDAVDQVLAFEGGLLAFLAEEVAFQAELSAEVGVLGLKGREG
jgi:hypothetical protein